MGRFGPFSTNLLCNAITRGQSEPRRWSNWMRSPVINSGVLIVKRLGSVMVTLSSVEDGEPLQARPSTVRRDWVVPGQAYISKLGSCVGLGLIIIG